MTTAAITGRQAEKIDAVVADTTIVGRTKGIIITAAGKNIAPPSWRPSLATIPLLARPA